MKIFIKSFIKILRGSPRNKKHEILKPAFVAVNSWKISGEFFEFGVYQGRTTIEAFKMSKKLKMDILFFAFDSFEGLPSTEETDGKFYEGQYSCSKRDYLDNISKAGVNNKKVKTIIGFYDESLTTKLQEELSKYKASIVWIDCDLYYSTKSVLEFITPFLQNGTIICYDDWFSFGGDPTKGEIRATNEWLERNKKIRLMHYRDFGYSGRSFVVQIYPNTLK